VCRSYCSKRPALLGPGVPFGNWARPVTNCGGCRHTRISSRSSRPAIAVPCTPDPTSTRRWSVRAAGRQQDAVAAYAGTAPIEVSSGSRVVHRLSRRGNRRLKYAIHMAAITQIRHRHSDGRAYYDKKITEGKTPSEALRVLKRRITNTIYARLRADTRHITASPAKGPGDIRWVLLSSRFADFLGWARECGLLVVVLAGCEAVVEAAEETAEQVALSGGVPVSGVFPPVVVGAGTG